MRGLGPFVALVLVLAGSCLLAALVIGGGSAMVDHAFRGQPGITTEELAVFLPSDTAVTTLSLLCFNRPVQNQEVLDEMTRRNLRPVTREELEALGKQYPNKQRWFPIVELGTVWIDPGGFQVCEYLTSQGFRSTENAVLDATGWEEDDMRFAAVPI